MRAAEFGQPARPGAVGVPAGQMGQGAAGRDEPGFGAGADGQVREGLRDVGLPDPDRAVEDDQTDSPARNQRSAARSRICAAGSFGLV